MRPRKCVGCAATRRALRLTGGSSDEHAKTCSAQNGRCDLHGFCGASIIVGGYNARAAARRLAPVPAAHAHRDQGTRRRQPGLGPASVPHRDGVVRSEPSEWSTNAAAATVVQDGKYGAQILHARWDGGERVPTLEVVSTVTTQDRAIDFDKPAASPHCLMPSVRSTPSGTALIQSMAWSSRRRTRSWQDWSPITTKRGPSTSGSSRTPSGTARCAGVAVATSLPCSASTISAASART